MSNSMHNLQIEHAHTHANTQVVNCHSQFCTTDNHQQENLTRVNNYLSRLSTSLLGSSFIFNFCGKNWFMGWATFNITGSQKFKKVFLYNIFTNSWKEYKSSEKQNKTNVLAWHIYPLHSIFGHKYIWVGTQDWSPYTFHIDCASESFQVCLLMCLGSNFCFWFEKVF